LSAFSSTWLPLRLRLTEQLTGRALLELGARVALEAFANAEIPIERLIDEAEHQAVVAACAAFSGHV
jgi:hypothetical protein